MLTARNNHRFCGREFTPKELSLIREVVETCAGISRTELSHTVCELLKWRRPNGGLKSCECLKPSGEVGKSGIFDPSGEPGHRTEERYEATYCASDRRPILG